MSSPQHASESRSEVLLTDPSIAILLGTAIRNAGSATGHKSILALISGPLPFTSSLSTILLPEGRPILLHDDISPTQREAVVDAYLRGAYMLDPFYTYVCEKPGTGVVRLRDIQPDHFRKTDFFRNYYAHVGLADEIGVIVGCDDGSHIFVSLGRDTGTGRFPKRGLERLVSLLPVIESLLLRNWGERSSDNRGLDPASRVRRNLDLKRTLELHEFESLTTREREIVEFILLGHSSKSIARYLGISPGTVKNHRKHVYRKLAIESQSGLFARFICAACV